MVYALTGQGQTLSGILHAMLVWGEANPDPPRTLRSRRRTGRRSGPGRAAIPRRRRRRR
ncbi:hypothetical protein OHA72_34270 [Dactylosporangium sp. NBC_01737]|nr:hypothetical protein OHA72_34270 [Dactylosporangium sp. NBC_01737]